MSRRNKDKGRIEGPFVPMLNETMRSAAWKAMSPYARVLYVALKAKFSFTARNNGRIYLSTRDGAEETGFNDKTVARCLRELQHYGFIMTEAGCLGVNGKGKAPHWRLTEVGYMHEPPTKDFLKWDGEMFHEQKSPEYYKRQERRIAKLRAGQKQNPAPAHGADCTSPRCIPLHQGTEQLPEKVHQPTVHIDEQPCTSPRRISRVNHFAAPSVGPVAVPDSAPDSIADADLPWATTDDLSIPSFLDRRAEIDLNDAATVAVQRRGLDDLAKRLAEFEPFREAAE